MPKYSQIEIFSSWEAPSWVIINFELFSTFISILLENNTWSLLTEDLLMFVITLPSGRVNASFIPSEFESTAMISVYTL